MIPATDKLVYLVVHPTNRKWVVTLVINGISGVSPLIIRVITHLLSGMNHQAQVLFVFGTIAAPKIRRSKSWTPGCFFLGGVD